jgi:hypothetical protein
MKQKYLTFRFWFFVLTVVALPPLCVETRKRFPGIHAHAAATKMPVPALTAHYHEELDNTQRRRISTRWKVAYREDGAQSDSREYFTKEGASYKQMRTIRFPDGRTLTIFDSDKVVSSVSYPAANYEHWKNTAHHDPSKNCASDLVGATMLTPIGAEQRSAFDAVHFRANRASGLEVWHSPSLGCLLVGRKATFRDKDGNISDTSELILDFVTRGTPDSALFAVPADYEEVKPSEANRRVLIRTKADAKYFTALDQDLNVKRQDESYQQHHSR